jgi:hypothetical protein
MEAQTSAHPRLARAYLALSDDPAPPAPQRSAPRALGAVAAAIVLALAAPVAWASAASGRPPADQPAATTAGKGGMAAPEADDEDGDGGDGPPGGVGDTWAATNQ